MSQMDWVGDAPSRRVFKDIANVRPSVAERKAELSLALRELLMRPPAADRIDSINKVRRYKQEREAVLKIASDRRSSVPVLEGAINTMLKWREPSRANQE